MARSAGHGTWTPQAQLRHPKAAATTVTQGLQGWTKCTAPPTCSLGPQHAVLGTQWHLGPSPGWAWCPHGPGQSSHCVQPMVESLGSCVPPRMVSCSPCRVGVQPGGCSEGTDRDPHLRGSRDSSSSPPMSACYQLLSAVVGPCVGQWDEHSPRCSSCRMQSPCLAHVEPWLLFLHCKQD